MNGAAPRPLDLEAYVGNFAGSSYGVWWDGEELVYESFEPGYNEREQVRLDPSPAQWTRFWRTMDELDVWQWQPRYEQVGHAEPASVISDATHWSLTLVHEDRRVVSSGHAAGPGAETLGDSNAFDAFCAAVSRLTGGRKFA